MQGPEDAKPLFDAGDWIALGAAIVALVAMSIAIWQAYEARQSRKATRDQADTAKEALDETKKQSAAAEKSATAAMLSLGAAERAAGAAEDQVVLARKAVRAAEEQASQALRQVEIAQEHLDHARADQADKDLFERRERTTEVLALTEELLGAAQKVQHILVRNTEIPIRLPVDPYGQTYLETYRRWDSTATNALGRLLRFEDLGDALGAYAYAHRDYHCALSEAVNELAAKPSGRLDYDTGALAALGDGCSEAYRRLADVAARAIIDATDVSYLADGGNTRSIEDEAEE